MKRIVTRGTNPLATTPLLLQFICDVFQFAHKLVDDRILNLLTLGFSEATFLITDIVIGRLLLFLVLGRILLILILIDEVVLILLIIRIIEVPKASITEFLVVAIEVLIVEIIVARLTATHTLVLILRTILIIEVGIPA
jgi:hypothetical protein